MTAKALEVLIAIIGFGALAFGICLAACRAFCALLLPYTRFKKVPIRPLLCRTCGDPIRNCNHVYGVPSRYHHRKTGSQWGPDGHEAEHP